MSEHRDALALFSGGLDSILAARMVMAQGLSVLGLHFTTPFFGHPRKVDRWQEQYGVDIRCLDISAEYLAMMAGGPEHGFGKFLNPCVDCKILMLRRARSLLGEYGAKMILSGEVVGQRPMSQRRDALAVISRDAGVRDVLLRPLCAKKVDPTPVEEAGLVDRERLGDFWGRGRKAQLEYAACLGITEIPTPAGGCRLTEAESAKRYHPLLIKHGSQSVGDYVLANIGRQFWAGDILVATGRNQTDNKRLEGLARDTDHVLKTRNFPGPLGLVRTFPARDLAPDEARALAAHVASYSPKARRVEARVEVAIRRGDHLETLTVTPDRTTPLCLAEPTVEEFRAWRRKLGQDEAEARKKAKKERR